MPAVLCAAILVIVIDEASDAFVAGLHVVLLVSIGLLAMSALLPAFVFRGPNRDSLPSGQSVPSLKPK